MSAKSLRVLIKRLDKGLELPEYAYPGDAGCDLRSAIDCRLKPGERVLVPTGIAIAVPEGYAGLVVPRSGLAVKYGISVVNGPGLIDSHYRGEIKVVLINQDQLRDFVIERGDRVAQLVITAVPSVTFSEVDELEETPRGANGFGSSGQD